jgi:hypothetical protein
VVFIGLGGSMDRGESQKRSPDGKVSLYSGGSAAL